MAIREPDSGSNSLSNTLFQNYKLQSGTLKISLNIAFIVCIPDGQISMSPWAQRETGKAGQCKFITGSNSSSETEKGNCAHQSLSK